MSVLIQAQAKLAFLAVQSESTPSTTVLNSHTARAVFHILSILNWM